jgi:hypothetical protein
MNTHPPRPSPEEFARLLDQARHEAVRLRNEAIATVWADAAAALRAAVARWRQASPAAVAQRPQAAAPCPR